MEGTQRPITPQESAQREAPPQPAPPAQPAPGWAPVAKDVFDPRRKSPALACVLSLMPGLGQIYVGYYVRGFVHLIVVAAAIALVATGDMDEFTPLFGMFIPFFWLYNIIDAGRRAAIYNNALAGGSEMDLPGDLQVPGFRGTVAGGVTLVVIGVVLLSNTALGFSLEWLEEWWPLAFIGFGGYLVWKAMKERVGQESPRAIYEDEI